MFTNDVKLGKYVFDDIVMITFKNNYILEEMLH